LSHNGNEFIPTPEREIVTLQIGGECFQLGRGESSPTCEDLKENSEEKTYFHPVRLPCHDASEDAPLPTESRLSSSWQQEAASPDSERGAERRPTKRIWTALSPAIKPTGYQNSRMREFNREFGYKTRKHPSEERRKCNKLGRGDQAGSDIGNVSDFNKYAEKANVRFRGRVEQKLIQETNPLTGSRCDAKKSTKPSKIPPITARDILESLRLIDQGLQRDPSDEEDLHELCTDDLETEFTFQEIPVVHHQKQHWKQHYQQHHQSWASTTSNDLEPINTQQRLQEVLRYMT